MTRSLSAIAKTTCPSRLDVAPSVCPVPKVSRVRPPATVPDSGEIGSDQRLPLTENMTPADVQLPRVTCSAAVALLKSRRSIAPLFDGGRPSSGTHHQSSTSETGDVGSRRPSTSSERPSGDHNGYDATTKSDSRGRGGPPVSGRTNVAAATEVGSPRNCPVQYAT